MIQDPDPCVDVELEKFCDWLCENKEAYEPFSLSFRMMKAIWIFGKAGHDAWQKVFVPQPLDPNRHYAVKHTTDASKAKG